MLLEQDDYPSSAVDLRQSARKPLLMAFLDSNVEDYMSTIPCVTCRSKISVFLFLIKHNSTNNYHIKCVHSSPRGMHIMYLCRTLFLSLVV